MDGNEGNKREGTSKRRPSEEAMIDRPGDVAFMPDPRLVPDRHYRHVCCRHMYNDNIPHTLEEREP